VGWTLVRFPVARSAKGDVAAGLFAPVVPGRIRCKGCFAVGEIVESESMESLEYRMEARALVLAAQCAFAGHVRDREVILKTVEVGFEFGEG